MPRPLPMRQLRLLPSRPRHTSLPLKSTSRAYAPVSRPPTPWGLPTTSRPTSSPRSRLSSRSPSRWVSATAGARCAGRARSDRPGDHLPERSQNDGRVTVARLRRWHPRARRGRSAASASCHNDSRVSCASQEGHVQVPARPSPRRAWPACSRPRTTSASRRRPCARGVRRPHSGPMAIARLPWPLLTDVPTASVRYLRHGLMRRRAASE